MPRKPVSTSPKLRGAFRYHRQQRAKLDLWEKGGTRRAYWRAHEALSLARRDVADGRTRYPASDPAPPGCWQDPEPNGGARLYGVNVDDSPWRGRPSVAPHFPGLPSATSRRGEVPRASPGASPADRGQTS